METTFTITILALAAALSGCTTVSENPVYIQDIKYHTLRSPGLFTPGVKMIIREDEEGTAALAWNRRLTLKLFREEAEGLIETEKPEAPEATSRPASDAPEKKAP